MIPIVILAERPNNFFIVGKKRKETGEDQVASLVRDLVLPDRPADRPQRPRSKLPVSGVHFLFLALGDSLLTCYN